ncbi:MAG: adenosylcobinamide-phosphate synthase CbiB [Verrucomicrobiota bacterium]|nr:adenosylcobinamide-phosphate synthase CbiB [Verrucomicrobiota bacterium]
MIAIGLDLLLGDPRSWPHPTKIAGAISVSCEKMLASRWPRSVYLGSAHWILVVGGMLILYVVAYWLCSMISRVAVWFLEIAVLYQAIAARDLARHAHAVFQPLQAGDLQTARAQLGRIVGRDTQSLDESEISRATIESVAESTSDGVVAPLVWTLIAGTPGALLYRTANTLDSLVGHRTEVYERFGKVSARIDDLLNWIPARICALGFCLFHSAVRWNAVRREAAAHASPNAGWSEAAMAYALGVRLGGDNSYDGQSIQGPVFHAAGRAATSADVPASLGWMWRITGASAAAVVLISFALQLLIR